MTTCPVDQRCLWCAALVVLLMAGCGGGGKEAAERQDAGPQAPPPAAGRTRALYDQADPARTSAAPAIKILPETPAAQDALEAVMSGIHGPVTWHWERNGKVIAGATSSRLPKGAFARGDEVTAVAMTRGGELKATARIGNSPPKVTSVIFFPANLRRWADITAKPDGADADGDRIEYHYHWIVNGEELPVGDTPVLKGDRIRREDTVSVRVTPGDGIDNGKPYITVPITISNAPPRFTSTPPSSFQGHVYSYQTVAEDPDGDALTYSLAASPHGMTIDSRSGKIEWKISTDSAGTHTVEVAAKDTEGLQAIQKFTVTIKIPLEEKSE